MISMPIVRCICWPLAMSAVLALQSQSQSQSPKFLFRKEIYIEHQNIHTAIHDQDWSVKVPSGSFPRRLLLYSFNINSTVIWKSFHNIYKVVGPHNYDRIIHNIEKIMLRDKITVTVKWKDAFSLKIKKVCNWLKGTA